MSVSHPKSYFGGQRHSVILPGLALPHRFLCHGLVKNMFGFNALILCLFFILFFSNGGIIGLKWTFGLSSLFLLGVKGNSGTVS